MALLKNPSIMKKLVEMAAQSSKGKRKNASGNRSDPGWDHATEEDTEAKKVKCNYCRKIFSGGIFRLKHHLAGTRDNAGPCLQVPHDVKEKFRVLLQSNAEITEKKKKMLSGEYVEVESCEAEMLAGRKRIGIVGKKKQGTLNQMYKKEDRDEVCQQIARFLYTSAIPFNVVNNPEFTIMVENIAKYGIGLKPPSYHEVRVKFLKKEVSSVMDVLEEHKEEWKRKGCTIMSDGWTDRQRRTICNFLVNSPKGSFFLKSVDASDISKTAEKVFDMLDHVVEEVGEENVVQIVTDNAANYKAAGQKLMEKRKRLFWTPCAAHCIDLILEDFDKKLKVHNLTIGKARKVTTFIYSHTLVHTWLKGFTKGRELIRPGATRFATSYLTLQSLNDQRGPLLTMFASEQWTSSRFASIVVGRKVEKIVLDVRGFWNCVTSCLRATLPLVKVLRKVDGEDIPAMGFIYKAMEEAKNEIKENFNNTEKYYKPVLDIIDARWESQLHQPLHAASYYLNPHYHYSPDFKANAEIKIGLYNCLQRMIPDSRELLKIDLQIDEFKNAKGLFGLPSAVMSRTKKAPADWWDSYGDECPELKQFAIRILSLTCSSSGCERNWSAFEMVHTKKRNRLHQKTMSDLVFVMYNLKLKARKQQKQPTSMQAFELDGMASDDEWITEVDESSEEVLNVPDRDSNDEVVGDESGSARVVAGVDDLATNIITDGVVIGEEDIGAYSDDSLGVEYND